MDSEVLANLNWREGLIAVVVLLAIYLIVVFLRYRAVQHEKNLSAERASFDSRSALAAYAAVQDPQTPEPVAEPPVTSSVFAWNEPPADTPQQQLMATLERDLAQLRKEVGGLRAEVMLLREAQQRDLAKTHVTEKVSPVYSDAMQMAIDGHDAAAISQHCGISRAEAELVVALVRNRDS